MVRGGRDKRWQKVDLLVQELVEIRSRLSHFQLEGEDITDLLHRQVTYKPIIVLCKAVLSSV